MYVYSTYTPPWLGRGQFTFTFAFYGQLRSITCTQNNTRDFGVLITHAETTHALGYSYFGTCVSTCPVLPCPVQMQALRCNDSPSKESCLPSEWDVESFFD